ncbi:MAG: peptidylprolyl isomerase, partial [Aquamicrobium sp.]|nr:peptidylprolyl isomerase [Aquamicrobium sp.]
MATVYQARMPGGEEGYTRRREPDTTVPPRARLVLAAITVNGRPV